jgi:glycosyltransferase involved in cell wall biosynthesis
MKVAILVANPFIDNAGFTDPRVDKQARALLQAGHEVVVLGTGREGEELPRCETRDRVIIVRRTTVLQHLYTRWLGHGERKTPGPQPIPQKAESGYISRLVRRLLAARHNLNLWLFYLAIVPAAVRQRADVYVGHDLIGLFPAYLAARLTGAKLVYDSRELWTERVRGFAYYPWQKAMVAWQEKMLARRCDLVIAVSQSVAQILAERYQIPMPLVIFNVHPYRDVAASAVARARLAGGADCSVVIYAGFLDYGKGLPQLVEAAQYLDGVVIALVGDGVLLPALEARVTELGLQDKVRFIGWVKPDELPTYVASADLGVSPIEGKWLNYYHNLDNKFFTYVMGGIPLAVSDQPEKRKLVEQYGIGATFDESDPRDIARVITGLLSDPVRYQAMRTNCRKAAREALNWEVVSRQYVSALERICAK